MRVIITKSVILMMISESIAWLNTLPDTVDREQAIWLFRRLEMELSKPERDSD